MNDSTNGKPAAKQEIQKPLSASKAAMIAAGLTAYQETAQEVEELRSQIESQRRDLMARDMEITSLKERMDQQADAYASQITALESRSHEHQIARDTAVSEAVALKTILASMKRIWDLARIDEPARVEESHDG